MSNALLRKSSAGRQAETGDQMASSRARSATSALAPGLAAELAASPRQVAQRRAIRLSLGPPARPGLARSGPPLQRQLALKLLQGGVVGVKTDGERPGRSSLPGNHQGDHTTPFVVLQAQIRNALDGTSLDEAWENLHATLEVYTELPGWEESKKFVQVQEYGYTLELLNARGDVNALERAANQLLSLRNQVALSALPGGHSGKGEGGLAGGLQYAEDQVAKGGNAPAPKDCLVNMVELFDGRRVPQFKSKAKLLAVLSQHAVTVVDAYPRLSEANQITDALVYKQLRAKFKV